MGLWMLPAPPAPRPRAGQSLHTAHFLWGFSVRLCVEAEPVGLGLGHVVTWAELLSHAFWLHLALHLCNCLCFSFSWFLSLPPLQPQTNDCGADSDPYKGREAFLSGLILPPLHQASDHTDLGARLSCPRLLSAR